MDARITALRVNQFVDVSVNINTPFMLQITTAGRAELCTDQEFVRRYDDWRDMLGVLALYGLPNHRHLHARCVRFARNNRRGVLPDLLR